MHMDNFIIEIDTTWIHIPPLWSPINILYFWKRLGNNRLENLRRILP